MASRGRISWLALISRIRLFTEGVIQEVLGQSGREADGFKLLAKADTTFGNWVRGGGGSWRWRLEVRARGQGKVLGGFYVRTRRDDGSGGQCRRGICKIGKVGCIKWRGVGGRGWRHGDGKGGRDRAQRRWT